MAIDRYELVSRHNPTVTKPDRYSPLSVGNGELTYTADITGMQTFGDLYEEGIPLCTQAQWGWHSFPRKESENGLTVFDLNKEWFDVNGRKIGYTSNAKGQEEAYHWLRQNPHRLNLAKIGLNIKKNDGSIMELKDLKDAKQFLNMWEGYITGSFFIDSTGVNTFVCCHPDRDILAFKVKSELFIKNGMSIEIAFPYGSPEKNASDWTENEGAVTEILSHEDGSLLLVRKLDNDKYFVRLAFPAGSDIFIDDLNKIIIRPREGFDEIDFLCEFSKDESKFDMPTYEQTVKCCKDYWQNYWETGGIIDFSECTDKRAYELERRAILSQYLLAVQCAGSLPPQETGLTFNSWYGKFHLEMHWWHGVHFPLWGRSALFEKSLNWYETILPKAKELAASQGYTGARWPKMTSPEGYDSPSPIGPFLIWQQPHPIYYAELLYKINPRREVLEKYSKIVFETADFMASYAEFDSDKNRYVLGPALIPMGENHRPCDVLNPVFELEYWNFGLKTANEWKKRLGMISCAKWEDISVKLSDLPRNGDVYVAHENCPDTYESFNKDHPAMLGAFGVLQGLKADKEIMANTLEAVLKFWDLDELWGWDFPMMAMTAARLGKPETAVDVLLMDSPKNEYLPNGHNKQADRKDLPIYLPGNGALLTALALMTVGYEGCEDNFSGFPKDGCWNVKWEGIHKLI